MAKLRVPLSDPKPDCERFCRAVMSDYVPPATPLMEFSIAPGVARQIVTERLGRTWVEPLANDRASQQAYWDNQAELWFRLGYDCIRVALDCRLPYHMHKLPGKAAHLVGLHKCLSPAGVGPIATWEDFRAYPWPTVSDADLFPVEQLARTLPEGMGILVGYDGGVFEHLVGLLGMEGLCLRLYDQPGLVAAVAERLGDIMVGYYERALGIQRVCGLFPGDNMGFHGSTFVSPEHLRQYVLPWHARFAAMAHDAGRPYFLHSDGHIEDVMFDLVDTVGIDAKHGFDDSVCPVEPFKRRWGPRLGVLGGVCLSALTALPPEELRTYVRKTVEQCRPGGGFALGSGLCITEAVPVENYLTMLDEAMNA